MKKFITSLSMLCISLCALHTNAQVTGEDLHARFGIKGGVNFSNLYTKDGDENSEMLTGFNAGLFAKIPVSRHFAIQPELYYSTKGAKINYNSFVTKGSTEFNLNYLELPILAVVNVTDNFNIHVGPYVSYLIGGKAVNDANFNLIDFRRNINNEDYNKLDAGIAVGLGFDIGHVGIGARYNYGLTKIGKEQQYLGNTYRFPNANNGVASLYLAISFL